MFYVGVFFVNDNNDMDGNDPQIMKFKIIQLFYFESKNSNKENINIVL